MKMYLLREQAITVRFCKDTNHLAFEMRSQEQLQKFHTDDVSLPRP